MPNEAVTCPGCEVELPANGWAVEVPGLASTECWELYGEVQGATIDDPRFRGRRKRDLVVEYVGLGSVARPSPRCRTASAGKPTKPTMRRR